MSDLKYHDHKTFKVIASSSGHLFFFALLALLLTVVMTPSAQAAVNKKYASLVMDADTGMILSERYADKSLHPASLTKIMTMALTFDALQRGDLRLRDRITISRHAASMVPSKLGLEPGSTIRVDEALYALATKSANDIAVALAERIGGSESHFAVMMNQKARQVGMGRSHFRNASGLHHPRQVSTARDMAKLASYTLKTYPQYYHYFSTRTFTYQGVTYRNHNKLLDSYQGMDGFKTGYIGASGFNLVASAKRGNHRLIGVVFGGRSGRTRNAHMAQILDQGFSRINEIMVASAAPLSAPIPAKKPVSLVTLASVTFSKDELLKKTAESARRLAELSALLQDEDFSEIIGQGDTDPAAALRLETGLLAISSIRRTLINDTAPVYAASLSPAAGATYENSVAARNWAIQIGAFMSRVKTDQALKEAHNALPEPYKSQTVATIVPLRTHEGWLFRGRLNGLSKDAAEQACQYLTTCLTVSPAAY